MKKALIGAALAAIVLAPMSAFAASATLYGNFRYSIANVDVGASPTSTTLDGVNNASRLGVKGSAEKDGLTGFFNYQMGAVNDGSGAKDSTVDSGTALTSRFYFGGIKGGFGTVKYGRLSTAYKMAAVAGGFDPFYDTSAGNGHGGANYGLSGLTNSFTDNSLEYSSPSFNGVKLNAGFYIDNRDKDLVTDHGHGYGAGVSYSGNGITGGIQYLTSDGQNVAKATDVDDAIRFSARYKQKMFSVGGSYETISSTVPSADDAANIYINATYSPIEDLKIAVAYGNEDKSVADGDFDGDGYSAGVFYNILPKTQIYAMYSTVDADVDTQDRDTFALGVVHSFSLSTSK